MKYYAILDSENSVENVIPAPDDVELAFYENFFGKRCIETFTDGSQRQKFAARGGAYVDELDAFTLSKPYPSWVLNKETAEWEAPQVKPADDDKNIYSWDEENLTWKAEQRPVDVFTQADKDLLSTVSNSDELEAIKDQLSEEAQSKLWPPE